MTQFNVDIFKPEWLNVVFAGRNQAYGAYQLRRQNAGNTNRALITGIGIFLTVIATPTIINKIRGFIPDPEPKVLHVENTIIPPPPIIIPKVEPVQPKQEAAKSKTDVIKDIPPVVTRDARSEPPTDAEIAKADIGQANIKGDEKEGKILIDEPASDHVKTGNITEANGLDDNTIKITVEIMPAFPGGEEAFGKFLQKNIRYPEMAKDANIQGRAYIQFVVERDGSLTDIKIVRNPGAGTGEEAERVLKISPHWKPGIQNGRPVRVQYTVPINFSLGN